MKIAQKNVKLKNGKTILLRSANEADAEQLLKHLRVSHSESYKNLNQFAHFWNSFSVEEERKILADFESAKNKFMIVAEFEASIVGGLGLVGQTAEFVKHNASLGMSIQRAFCNSGLGTEMMLAALENARQAGIRRIELTVRTYNSEGIALYEKVGFQRIGVLKSIAYIDGQYVDEYSYQQILM